MIVGDEIYGLVICGGQSTRMGTDKSLLDYHGQPQRYYVYNMLESLCGKAFISCNAQQAAQIPGSYNVIVDAEDYTRIGPMAGLLSAFEKYPNHSFLVMGCDYPFVEKDDLKFITESVENKTLAATYYNNKEQVGEPLIGIYKSGSYARLKAQFEKGDYSLNHFLKEVNAGKIIPASSHIIESIDTLEKYKMASDAIIAMKPSNLNHDKAIR